MRFRTKLILVTIAVLAGWFVFSKTFESLKEKYFYKFAANRLHVYAEKNWGVGLYIGYAKGSIFKDLSLKNISVDNIKNLPGGFQIKADSLDLTYPVFGLLFGKFDGKFENLRIIYKDIVIPIDAYQREGLAVIAIRRNAINLGRFSDAFPPGVSLSGTLNAEGEVILKKLKPHLINISVDSKDFQLKYKSSRKMKGIFKIEASGKADTPRISGGIKVTQASVDGGLSFLSLFKTLKFPNNLLGRSSMDIDIKGENIAALNKYLNADLSATLKLKKESSGKPYILGAAVINGGTFRFRENQFRIIRGEISFTSSDKDPLFDVDEETNIGWYRISAKVEGSEKNMRFTLSSRPELPHSEIASLLLFGKETKDLATSEKDKLTQANFNDILINNLFSK